MKTFSKNPTFIVRSHIYVERTRPGVPVARGWCHLEIDGIILGCRQWEHDFIGSAVGATAIFLRTIGRRNKPGCLVDPAKELLQFVRTHDEDTDISNQLFDSFDPKDRYFLSSPYVFLPNGRVQFDGESLIVFEESDKCRLLAENCDGKKADIVMSQNLFYGPLGEWVDWACALMGVSRSVAENI